MKLQGIDVSHHNAPAAAPINVDFGIVRVSFGMPDGRTLPDESAERHLGRLASARVPVLAAYHYLSTAAGSAEGEAQADVFLQRHAALEARFGPLGMACDSEPLRAKDAKGNPIPWDPVDRVRDRVMGWLAAMPRRPCLMYGSREWWARIKLPWWVALHCQFWAASQGEPPAPWINTAIQQLLEPVAGVDRNTFAGSVEELRGVFGIEARAGYCPATGG